MDEKRTASPRLRPRNLEEYLRLYDGYLEPPPLPDLKLRSSDVLIATYPKCGTTWVQQIVHGLRTCGSMDFEDIFDVIPWIEVAPLLGIDLAADQVAEPRAYKTHLAWNDVPKGGRYIYVIREPGDAMLSFYNMLNGVYFEQDAIDVTEYCNRIFIDPRYRWPPGYWQHLRSFWEYRHDEHVLFLCFEDLKSDLQNVVRRIARFIGVRDDEARISIATRQASFEFMRSHAPHFDERSVQAALLRQEGLPEDVCPPRIRTGNIGDSAKLLPKAVRDVLDVEWAREIAAPLGISSYEAMREYLANTSHLEQDDEG